MLKKICVLCLCIFISAFGIAGCGASFPDLTTEQEDVIAEYAAGLLVKYSEKSPSRLTDTTGVEPMNPVTPEEAEPETDITVSDEPEDLQNDAEIIDMTNGGSDTGSVNSYASIAEALLLNGITVNYKGYSVLDSYPEEGDLYFSLDAADGCKLVVLKLELVNTSNEEVSVDFMSSSDKFKVSLDGIGFKNAMSTMLLDDLSTYMGKIKGGATENLVLLTEWKEEDVASISNFSLYIKNSEGVSATFTLE